MKVTDNDGCVQQPIQEVCIPGPVKFKHFISL